MKEMLITIAKDIAGFFYDYAGTGAKGRCSGGNRLLVCAFPVERVSEKEAAGRKEDCSKIVSA